MVNFRQYFKGKTVTVVGLGLLGKRLLDIQFLCEMGAKVLVTDLKQAKELAPSIKKLKKFTDIKYVLGEHRLEDFENCDFVLKGQGVPLDSPFINHARKKGIPIEMDESLFAKLAPKVTIVGVTGTRGKSTTTMLIYEILKKAKFPVYLGGNIKGTAALPLLKKVKPGDIVVLELSSWQLQGFGEANLSPHIALFTNFMSDHLNYYKKSPDKYWNDKSHIYKYQKPYDLLVLGPSMSEIKTRGIIRRAKIKNIPQSWKINLLGRHNTENVACALEVAKFLKVDPKIVKKVLEKFPAPTGRLEKISSSRGVVIYNDTNATTPEATMAALKSFPKKVILIMGGSDKGLALDELIKVLPLKTKKIFLLPGSGSEKIKPILKNMQKVKDLKEAVTLAKALAEKGDTILFSPAFASFGMFKNEYDRGDIFVKLVRKIK